MQMTNALAYSNDDIYINTLETSCHALQEQQVLAQ